MGHTIAKSGTNISLEQDLHQNILDFCRLGRGRKLIVMEFTTAAAYGLKEKILSYYDHKAAKDKGIYINR